MHSSLKRQNICSAFFVPLKPVKRILLIIAYLTLLPYGEVGRGLAQNLVPNPIYGITCTYKVVVITPAARVANPNVNLKNYNEVKEVFNIKD